MRISVLGGGPAGLYFAILMKKAHPGHEISVLERNPPDATFGWGVVFSEGTLGALREADHRSHVEITDTFARWDAIDIVYRGELLRCGGHAFSAIARTRLLGILQRRCAELGVEPRFETEIDRPESLVEGADLVVAADGVNSLTRRAAPEAFGSTVRPQGCKYIWYGSDRVLDAFRFSFAQTGHGLIQAHAYPYDENYSTFVIEAPEQTWRRAGLDQMSEAESIAFCEDLFAADLAGRRLLSNKSAWLSFPLVRNRHWHHGKTVLLGDAAHTAHFSIGSGTKLAMEDAIALVNAFERHGHQPGAVGPALVEYAQERQPVVDRFQQAAAESAAYFERVGHHAHLPPRQFAVNLLTRSGRISHGALAVRDPGFVRAADAQFFGGRFFSPPPMLAPLTLGPSDTVLSNRIVCTATGTGAGLVFQGPVAVTEDGRTSPDDSRKGTVDEIHAEGALAGVRLGHAGRRGAVRPPQHGIDVPLPPDQAWPLLSASALPYGPGAQTPKAMDAQDMERVREAFADAAARAAEAGFDVCELDCAHGQLLASFISPLTNLRDDEYGADRLRYPLEVLAAVRTAWPGRPLVVRLSVTDWAKGGLSLEEGVHVAKAMAEAGADMIHVEAGQTVAESRPEYRRGFLTVLSDQVRSEARLPTLVGGYLTTTDEVNTIVAAGRADLCMLEIP